MAEKPDNSGLPFTLRIIKCFRDSINPAFSTIRFLLLIMLPVSFAILILKSTGLLYYISRFMNPLMQFLDLPGEAALAFVSSVFMNLYSAIAVIKTLVLSGKQLVILATMCLIAHSFFDECLVMKKTGSHLRKIVMLRLFVSVLAGWILSRIVPEGTGTFTISAVSLIDTPPIIGLNITRFLAGLGPWFIDSLFLVLRIFLIVFPIMFLQRILAEFGLVKKLGKIARPLIGFFGLSSNTAYVWIIAYTIGVAYGAGILVEEVKNGNLSRTDADLFNHHAALSHSQIEDTVLFVSLGVPYLWAALPRFVAAIIIVWLERVRRAIFRSSFRVKVV
ncbi:MAG: transporter [Spirochaetaceae bacterium]|jgi:spore maturation protein SpmB|nr:transporter [Spirochaetaceae bacterium]